MHLNGHLSITGLDSQHLVLTRKCCPFLPDFPMEPARVEGGRQSCLNMHLFPTIGCILEENKQILICVLRISSQLKVTFKLLVLLRLTSYQCYLVLVNTFNSIDFSINWLGISSQHWSVTNLVKICRVREGDYRKSQNTSKKNYSTEF